MKILVCGIPPGQATNFGKRWPAHDVRVLSTDCTEQRYIAHMTDCDVCVVNTRVISHKVYGVIRRTLRHAILVNGPSSAAAAVEAAIRR